MLRFAAWRADPQSTIPLGILRISGKDASQSTDWPLIGLVVLTLYESST
jgi:hypothetical protein